MQDKLCFLSSVALAALLAATLALVHGARARNLNGEHDNDPHKEWYESQRNKAGGSCCADGRRVMVQKRQAFAISVGEQPVKRFGKMSALHHAAARKVQAVEDDGGLCHPTVRALVRRGKVRYLHQLALAVAAPGTTSTRSVGQTL
jgi:hypothetical protein